MRTITHALDTRPFFLPSVLVEKKRPGNEANYILAAFIILLICTDAVFSLVVSGGVVSDGILQVCPGTTVSLTCSHDSASDLTRWVITPALPMDCDNGITHTTTPNSEAICGPFDVTMISARSEVTRMSTLEVVITTSLNNRVVTCYAGATTSDPQVGNYTLQIIGEVSKKLFYCCA